MQLEGIAGADEADLSVTVRVGVSGTAADGVDESVSVELEPGIVCLRSLLAAALAPVVDPTVVAGGDLTPDGLAVIGGDVIMSKVVLDISRETRPLRRRSSTRADFPTSDASPEPYAGSPAPPGRSPSAARGRRPRPVLTTGNS